jgi:hypothetical protein
MAINTNVALSSIIGKIEAQTTKEKQIDFLRLHSSYALKTIIGYGMDPGC